MLKLLGSFSAGMMLITSVFIGGCKGNVDATSTNKVNSVGSESRRASISVDFAFLKLINASGIVLMDYVYKGVYFANQTDVVDKVTEQIKTGPNDWGTEPKEGVFDKYAKQCFDDLLSNIESQESHDVASICKYDDIDADSQTWLVSSLFLTLADTIKSESGSNSRKMTDEEVNMPIIAVVQKK